MCTDVAAEEEDSMNKRKTLDLQGKELMASIGKFV